MHNIFRKWSQSTKSLKPESCFRKASYATREIAEELKLRWETQDPDTTVSIHHCNSCEQFHLTKDTSK